MKMLQHSYVNAYLTYVNSVVQNEYSPAVLLHMNQV